MSLKKIILCLLLLCLSGLSVLGCSSNNIPSKKPKDLILFLTME
jgi:hypothetical protein